MKHTTEIKSPFESKFSIQPFIESFDASFYENSNEYYKSMFQKIEKLVAKNGLSKEILIKHKSDFEPFFNIIIPNHISKNEIKIITKPIDNEILFSSIKFKTIECKNKHKDNFKTNLDSNELYKFKCIVILNSILNEEITFEKKIIYKIKNASDIFKSYLVNYDNSYYKIYPKDEKFIPTSSQINELLDDFENIEIWERFFPLNSWVIEGFSIYTLIENTVDNAVSELKSNLLQNNLNSVVTDENFEKIFKSIFNISDLEMGITLYNHDEDLLLKSKFNNLDIDSFILNNNDYSPLEDYKEDTILKKLITLKDIIIIQDLDTYLIGNPNSIILKTYLEQEIQSAFITPVYSESKLIGFIEIISKSKYALKKRNISKLNLILPILTNTIERTTEEQSNRIDAIIQNEYTAIHPSVYWKFKNQVSAFLKSNKDIEDYNFKDIIFDDVHALFGEIDIKGSSNNRIIASKNDIEKQLNTLVEIFDAILEEKKILIIEQIIFELNKFKELLKSDFEANSENNFKKFILDEVHPILKTFECSSEISSKIETYFNSLDKKMNIIYDSRKDYDQSVTILNKKMSSFLDQKQVEAQQIFPHYYERYATDGIEHNMYIGGSINPKKEYNSIFLNNLRLWQLKTLCETVYNYQKWKHILPFELEVTTLILVFSTPLTIRFRMDEKLFDVDGAYNARYEVVKKRIDKSCVKNSDERITQPNKVTIVYSQTDEKLEYMKYLKYLISKELIEPEIERLEVEDLQSVSGLKALRVTIKKLD